MSKRRALAVAALFLVAACTQCAGVTLRYQFKTGQVLKYKTMMTGAGEMTNPMGQPMRTVMEGSSTARHEVLDVDADGAATVEVQITEGEMKMTMGENEQKMPMPTQKMTVKMSTRGKVTPVKEEAGAFGGTGTELDMSDILGAMEFPEKDMKEGESWSGEAKIKVPMLGDIVLKFTEKYKGMKKVRGRECAVLDFTFEAPIKMDQSFMSASGKMAGSGTMYFDVKNGYDVQMTGQIIQVMNMTAKMAEESMEMKQTMKMNLKHVLVE